MLVVEYKCTNVDGVLHAYLADSNEHGEIRLCTNVEREKPDLRDTHTRGTKFCKKCDKKVELLDKKKIAIIKHKIVNVNEEPEKPNGCL